MEALDPLCTKHYRYQLKDRKTLAAKGEPFTMSIHETFKVNITFPNLGINKFGPASRHRHCYMWPS